MDKLLQADRKIAAQLDRAWPAFFGRFGRLTAVQREVIPTILDGEDVLVCSATASGKTEAVCAPLVEQLIDNLQPWTILYISPTRALVNDLHARLESPLRMLNLQAKRRTGDHREVIDKAPHILLTTPESFDSLLCRGRNKNGHVLAQVKAVVLDEIHLLHGTARGEQLRWLLQRLFWLKEQAQKEGWIKLKGIQVIGLSATIPDPGAVLKAFLPNGKTIIIPGRREIEEVQVPGVPSKAELTIPEYIRQLGQPEKILVFSNARRRVDDLAAIMRPVLEQLNYSVVAHHGSLSKCIREEAEKRANTEDKIVIFATSTLEIGIDIGDIHLVVLDRPAAEISALLQRIGRGNRRSNKTRVMVCSDNPLDDLIHMAMLEAAREGWLGQSKYGEQHAVAMQQVASYIMQGSKRERSRVKVQRFLDHCAKPIVAKSAIDTMLVLGELDASEAGIRLGEYWIEQSVTGKIHTNIEDLLGATVINEKDGEKIATGIKFHGGKGLHTGGQLLQVQKQTSFNIEVKKVSGESLANGQWAYVQKSWMKGDTQAQALKRLLGVAVDEWPIVIMQDCVYVFHFGGSTRKIVLQLIAEEYGMKASIGTVNELYIKLPKVHTTKPAWLQDIVPAVLEIGLPQKVDSLERQLARPYVNKKLPIDVRVDEIMSWLRIEDEVTKINRSRWYLGEGIRKELVKIID